MRLLDRPPVPRAIRLVGYRPSGPSPAKKWLGQIKFDPTVNVNPNVRVDAPINIELGSLPLSLGLFAGSATAFLMRTALPKGWPQTLGLVAGGGLAAAGILNLFRGKIAAAAPAAPGQPAALPPSASPSGAGATAQEVQPSMSQAFEAVTGIITSPQEYSTVSIHAWSSSYPARIQFSNPSDQAVNFTLELRGLESGSLGADQESAATVQIALNPRETKNVDLDMPMASGHLLDVVNVVLQAFKRRVATEPAQMLDQRSFIVK